MSLNQLLHNRMSALAEREQQLSWWCRLATCWAGAGLMGLGLVFLQRLTHWSSSLSLPFIILVACVSLALVVLDLMRRRQNPSPGCWRALAQQIEGLHPELEGRLLTAVQQEAPPGGQLNYLQQRLLQETLRHSHQHDWAEVIPRQRLHLAQLAHWLGFGLFAIVLLELHSAPHSQLLAGPGLGSSVTVTPGDTSIERGNSLVVLARFSGPLPPTVDLVINQAAEGSRIPLVKSLADPTFGGSVPEVTNNFTYRVNYGARSTRAYTVSVFEYPRLERANADLTFPAYTKQGPQHIENTRRISAVEGSSLDLALQLNKPVTVARLVPRTAPRNPVTLQVETNRPIATLKHFPLQSTTTYELELLDAEGGTNKVPAQFVFEVLSNRPPEMKLVSPRNDIRPSPLEEVAFQGTVWDDFGVEAFGLGYIIPGQPARFLELGHAVPAKEKRSFQYLLRLEELQVQPDELISWFLWADDLGSDGAVRRTTGDLYFAEVRPFEEVFREGQGMDGQGQGGQSGGGNQTARLADLQKQIISATWNLQRKQGPPVTQDPPLDRTNQPLPRRESRASEPSAKVGVAAGVSPALAPEPDRSPVAAPAKSPYVTLRAGTARAPLTRSKFAGQIKPPESPDASSGPASRRLRSRGSSGSDPKNESDVQVVLEAQTEALAQAEAAAERARDAKFTLLWNAATKQMNEALARLREATNSPAALKQALLAEQAAYQSLLKLQEHEYQVSRSRNRGQSGSGREQQMQRQLEELELTQSENRYENQREAQSPQTTPHREQLQIMNRLQELARRQKDLNERLKELQTALEEAKTAEEKAELQRRLKRLQEEEQQMLADVDEVRQRMDRPENQSQMADERRQLDQTRQDIQRASDAAAQGAAGQALASGTRAERQLQDLRDQLRKENSSQFGEELRSMRSEVRELAQKQQDIQKSLQAESSAEHKSLGAPADHQDLLQQLNRQKDLMTNLLDRATQVSQQSETSEPLLSSELYDSIRKFGQDTAKDVQESQDELLNRGLMSRSLFEQLKDDSELGGPKLLDITSDLVRRDFVPQAGEVGQRAGARVDDLKRGIERAAESVLGDETEALRLAKQELDQLTDQLQREMAGADTSTNQTNQRPSIAPAGDRQSGERQPREGQAGERQSGERPAGERVASAGTESKGEQAAREGGQGQPTDNQATGEQQASTQGRGALSRLDSDQSSQAGGSQARQSGDSPQNSGAETARRNGGRSNPSGGPLGGAAGADGGYAGGPGGGPWNFDRLLNDQNWRRYGPITGEGFVNWSDRLREIEEILDFPDLRDGVAAARERARLLRQQYKRDHKKPDWAVVRLQVVNPLAEVRDRIADELARRQSGDNLVPIDRDPVPTRYSDLVRRYYEELGKEK